MFPDSTTCPGFSVHILNGGFVSKNPGCQEKIVSLLADCFVNFEPLTVNQSIDGDKFAKHFVTLVVEKAVQDELSLVVVDDQTKEVVAVFINEDFHDTLEEDSEANREFDEIISTNIPELVPILELLKSLDASNDVNLAVCTKEKKTSFHAFMLATDQRFHGQGLAKNLSALKCKFAKDLGYKNVIVEATNPITARIFSKLGAKTVHSITPRDFVSKFNENTQRQRQPFVDVEHDVSLLVLDLAGYVVS